MIMRNCCYCLVLFALASSPAAARDIHVDNVGGDDRHEGRAPVASNVGGGPCRTIARALDVARSGDRIVLTDTGRPYRESVTLQGIRHSGSSTRPFVIAGGGAIIDGSRPVPAEAWEHYKNDIYRFHPPRTSYQQLFLNARPLKRVWVENNNLALPELKPFEWCLFERHIYVNLKKPAGEKEQASVPADVLEQAADEGWRYLPQQYDFSYAGERVGITLFDVRNVIIADVVVQGFQLDGINAHDKAFNVRILGATCRGNGRSGISIGGSSQVKVTESLLGNNGAAQLRTEGHSLAEVVACEILAHTAPSIVRDGGDVTIDGLPLRSDVLKDHVDPPRGPADADAEAPPE